jgi:hypothetical protein
MPGYIKNGLAPATSKQASFYKDITKGQVLPAGCSRQQASDLITAALKGGASRPVKAAPVRTPLPPAPKPKPKPAPAPSSKIVYQWLPDPLPAIPAECVPYESHVVKPTDEEILSFVPRQPYWDYLCDAHSDGRFVQMVGEGGCGKSLMGKALAFVTQLPYLPINCDGKLNPRVLFGQINIKSGTSGFSEGIFTQLTQVPSVIVLEEKNGLDGSVQMTFNRAFNNREFFIPEANGGMGKMYKLHPRCYMLGDCNPPGAKYTGAQRENVASVDRLQVIKVKQLEKKEIINILNDPRYADKLSEFYEKANEVINTNGYRCVVTLRGLKRASRMLNRGYSEKEAIEMGILNAIELTGGPDAQASVRSEATGLFDMSK